MLSLFRDVTAEIEAHHRAEELTRVFDASSDLVMIVDPTEFRLRWANDALTRFLGLDVATGTPLDAILDESSAKIFDDVGRPALAAAVAMARRSRRYAERARRHEVPISEHHGRLDGNVVAHRNVDGVMTAISIVARDVSALLDAEQRLEQARSSSPRSSSTRPTSCA